MSLLLWFWHHVHELLREHPRLVGQLGQELPQRAKLPLLLEVDVRTTLGRKLVPVPIAKQSRHGAARHDRCKCHL